MHAQANEGIHPLPELAANGALLFCIGISHGAGAHGRTPTRGHGTTWTSSTLYSYTMGMLSSMRMAGPSAHTGQTLVAGVPDVGSGAPLGCELANRMTPNRPSRTQQLCIMGSSGRAVCILATASPLV